jgi:tRNA (pseudouridine54-N1)-methyltransferase
MRRFIIVGHAVNPDGDFTLNDLCGGAGRLDVLLRCVSSAFFLSHSLRKDVEAYLVFPGKRSGTEAKVVRFCGHELRYVNPDERSTGALVRNALLRKLEGPAERRSTPGVYVSKRGFGELLASLPNIVWLAEDGGGWKDAFPGPQAPRPDGSGVRENDENVGDDVSFVLSDHHDFEPDEEEALRKSGARKVSLGPTSLHSNHCITVVHYLLDGAGSAGNKVL